MSRFNVSGGQFFQWRFIAPDLWWHSHPYSLSAMPRPPFIRVQHQTSLGMQSLAATRLKPGTRRFAQGPYGVLHPTRPTGRPGHPGTGEGAPASRRSGPCSRIFRSAPT